MIAMETADIYMYDLSTSKETRITTNPSASYYPAIYGDRIVWWMIVMETGISMCTISPLARKVTLPINQISTIQISMGQDSVDRYRNGNADIYMGTLSTSPVAAFSASPTSGKAPLKVTFTDKSTGTPTSWKWSFGDKTYSTAKNPVHKYTAAGKYTVSLTVKNAAGSNTKTMSGYIKVSKK